VLVAACGGHGSGSEGAATTRLTHLEATMVRRYPCVFGVEGRPACASYEISFEVDSDAPALGVDALALSVAGIPISLDAACIAGPPARPTKIEFTYTGGAGSGLGAVVRSRCGETVQTTQLEGLPPAPQTGEVTVDATGMLAGGAPWTASGTTALVDRTEGRITFVVAPDAAPPDFASLRAAHDAIVEPGDYDVLVRAGTYHDSFRWDAARTFADHTIRVMAWPGERPVFDGQRTGSTFISIKTAEQRPTNLVFDGLTIRRYYQGFSLDGGSDASQWSGGNTIRNCIFDDLGDRDGDGKGEAWAAIVFEYQRNDVIENNVFWDIYSAATDAPGQIHVLYLSHGSAKNVVRNNFMHNCSHDPFRLRNGANDNLIEGNYVDRAGGWAPITRYRVTTSGEDAVHRNRINNNLLLYGHDSTNATQLAVACYDNNGGGSGQVSCGSDEWTPDATTIAFFRPTYASTIAIPAAAAGDFDGDGAVEAVVAMRSSGIDRVVKSKLDLRYLGNVLWKSTTARVVALAAGHFDNSGRDQIVAAVRNGTRTVVSRGGGIGEGGLTDLGTVLDTADEVTALTAGDVDGDGVDDLVIALWDGTATRVVVGAQTIYTSTTSRITALTTGDLDGDGTVEIVTALTSGTEARIYASAGAANLTGRPLYTGGQAITALSAGELDGDASNGAELVVAFADGTVRRGDGTTDLGTQALYESASFRVRALVTADLDGTPGTDETLAAFVTQDGATAQVWAGNGANLLSNAKLYQWPQL
jgi:hypothetical protein